MCNTCPNLFQEKIYDLIVNFSYDGLTYTDEKGIIRFNNSSYRKISGYTDEDLIGKSIFDLEKRGYIISSIAKEVFEKKQTITRLIRYKEKLDRDVLVTVIPVFDPTNEFKGIIANVRDMTELESIKKKLNLMTKRYYDEKIKNILANQKLIREKENKKELLDRISGVKFVGASKHIRDLTELAYKVSNSMSPVLITGESGVGKDVVCQMIHQFKEKGKPLVKVSCGAIPENLIESELFGYEKGAFTNANLEGKKGMFELAEDGTIFLDEIGELPMHLQAKLLTATEDLKYYRVGGTKEIKIKARIITATNRDLWEMVEEGLFRRDLYYRLNVIPIHILPLRERKEDIIPLVKYFLGELNSKNNTAIHISDDLLRELQNHNWPGNVRELKNIIERLYFFNEKERIEMESLSNIFHSTLTKPQNAPSNLKDYLEEKEEEFIRKNLHPELKLDDIADNLGISMSTLTRKIRKYDLPRRYDR
ncbi:MAG TPA: sigma 54-interacting transcriptional regulator [Thermoanaerobacterales bacterium]|nr:sigma 54-interacting transcriptional regulator [Thermoanaerobacterales bacterium]